MTARNIAVFAVLAFGVFAGGRASEKHADVGAAKARGCVHGTKLYDKLAVDGAGIDRHSEDPNPTLIPSLADPSSAVGLLPPGEIDLADKCFAEPRCDATAPYRTANGGCNNLMFPVWGQSFAANTRIVQANYADGVNQTRKAVSGNNLPNVRHIRKAIFNDLNRPAFKNNLLVMQFSQTVSHDTGLIMLKTQSDGSPLRCCNPDGSTPDNLPERCLSIPIPPEESATSKNRCFTGARAADTLDFGCDITPVRQRIAVTSFLDASLLYGSDSTTANHLRSFTNGKLRTQIGPNGRSYLPNVQNPTQFCNVPNDDSVCYETGDRRVNQHPDMAVETISLLRLHNVLCDELKKINPSWDDERLYQEARRLLIAMYQHVIYSEFVPTIVGEDFARVNKLLPLNSGFDNNYNQFLNPTTFTSFTAVAFRSFHSLVQGIIDLYSENRTVSSNIRLSDFFDKTDIVQETDNYDSFTRGLLTQRAQNQDKYFTEEVSEFLFKNSSDSLGSDLISFDLARGRDFGEPTYNSFRQLCGLSRAQTFNDLSDQISRNNIDALASVYEDVDDIDFYAAGILEELKPGATSGHTFQCIMGEMFYRLKFGDRFYYEFGNQTGSFTLDQLNEIRKTTRSLIVCMTSDIIEVQRDAFNVPSPTNPLVPCSLIPKLNFSPWRDV